ncbi:hypothetical protein [Paraburkholderia unamae]|uniref:Uncharacterized protein n=1 Tax=Paraburkholderia unamae TaxID=219649 RepID=A0ACC6RQK0_9BURK
MSTQRIGIRFITDVNDDIECAINSTLRKWAAAGRCNRPGPWIGMCGVDLAAMPDRDQEMRARNLMTVRPLPCECNK